MSNREVKKYFDIRELVSKQVYQKHKERAWMFLDVQLLECLLIVRTKLNKPIRINTWHVGGVHTQSGLRDNTQSIFRKFFNLGKLYLSAHVMGKAIDFSVEGMTACEVRAWIVENEHLFPCKIRLERNLNRKPIGWVHLDVFQLESNPKIYLFDV